MEASGAEPAAVGGRFPHLPTDPGLTPPAIRLRHLKKLRLWQVLRHSQNVSSRTGPKNLPANP